MVARSRLRRVTPMNPTLEISEEVLVDVQSRPDELAEEHAVDEEPDLRPTVELETQGKVDTHHPDARPEGMTLEAQERFQAREAEIRATRQRTDFRQQSSRERRSRRVAGQGSHERRREVQERAASVRPSQGPVDPRERCSQAELAAINEKAARLVEQVDGWSRAAISRRLARRVVDGADIQSAALKVIEACQREPGTVIPIAAVGEVDRQEVSIEGTVATLWDSTHPAISQVGLIEDETSRIKFTSWEASRARCVQKGDHVVLRAVAKNWYEGRCSVALTGDSRVEFPERDRRLTR